MADRTTTRTTTRTTNADPYLYDVTAEDVITAFLTNFPERTSKFLSLLEEEHLNEVRTSSRGDSKEKRKKSG